MIDGWTVLGQHIDGNRNLELICNGFNWSDTLDEQRPSATRNLTTSVSLAGEDYDWLFAIRSSVNNCEPIVVVLTKGAFTADYNIKINQIKWDRDNCVATFTLRAIDDYTAIDENGSKEIDIFTNTTARTALPVFGVIVTQTVGPVFRNNLNYYNPLLDMNPAPAGGGWTLKDATISYLTSNPLPGQGVDGTVENSYSREEIISATGFPPGAGWISEGANLYARAVSMQEISRVTTELGFSLEQEVIGETTRYDNGRLFRDVLQLMFLDLGFQVNSRFFGMGDVTPLGDHDASVYDWSDIYVADLLIYQKSDIKRPNVSTNATNGAIKYEQIFKILDVFKQKYTIEDAATAPTTIRLEHETFFSTAAGIDITQPPFAEQVKGLRQLESESVTIPRRETFDWQEQTTAEFDGVDIIYPEACSAPEVEPFQADILNNNIVALSQPDNGQYTDAGFCLVSAVFFDGLYRILSQTDPLTGANSINNPMGWPVLHDILYRSNRPYITGNMNGVPVTFLSAQDTLRLPVAITKFSLADYVAFNPSDTITTQDGTAKVVESSYDEATCTLLLNLSLD